MINEFSPCINSSSTSDSVVQIVLSVTKLKFIRVLVESNFGSFTPITFRKNPPKCTTHSTEDISSKWIPLTDSSNTLPIIQACTWYFKIDTTLVELQCVWWLYNYTEILFISTVQFYVYPDKTFYSTNFIENLPCDNQFS